MGMKWTTEQEQVIALRDRDLLVSAAAGSGKTAVLVQRIIARITDPDHPMDIDRLIVVTFTKAAAAEMKERIAGALGDLKSKNPQDENLIRQSALIHNARICTIDSFCSYVVRNYFGTIGLDPNFRIADEGELRLLKEEVLDQLFEEEYQNASGAFLDLVDRYSGKRNDQNIKDMVSEICRKSDSSPWPRKWICSLSDPYHCSSVEEFMQLPVMSGLAEELKSQLTEAADGFRKCLKLAEEYGISKYLAYFPAYCHAFENLEQTDGLQDLVRILNSITFGRLPSVTAKDKVAPEVKTMITDEYNRQKGRIQDLQKQYGPDLEESAYQESVRLGPVMDELVRLSIRNLDLLEEKKRRLRIADFGDIAHDALRILVDEETGEPTEVAYGFRNHFEEIMIDEYQDSNQVQEEILRAVSGHSAGIHNMFMVGDVKQSIYRFRQAKPELFMQKYHTYSREDSLQQKIELHENFRSRKQVLEFANDMFFKLMDDSLGGISYDDNCALYPGAKFEDEDTNTLMEPEVLLADAGEAADYLKDQDQEKEGAHQIEAHLIAARIRELMNTLQVLDKSTNTMRPVRYSDIVILLRSLQNWGTDFAKVLEDNGIPVHVSSQTGYFSAMEVQTVLNYLKILDNPHQDIPMASVLKSAFAGLDNEMMAEIRAAHSDVPFSEAVLLEMQTAEANTPLGQFAASYQHFRSLSAILPIHELIQKILTETGYADYAASLPAGSQRAANLDVLLQKAIAYEKTSYKGLFHFVRYIDLLEKYDVDYGEADLTAENADVVRIMTMHKSKGLEFPVVFVSGLGKKFNTQDINAAFLIHPELGMALPEITAYPKVRRDGILRARIQEKLLCEMKGEELRVLYVALTRAKEKLILTGVVESEEKVYQNYEGNVTPKTPLPYRIRHDAMTMLAWVIPAVMSYPNRYRLQFIPVKDMILEEASERAAEDITLAGRMERIEKVPMHIRADFAGQLEYSYPYPIDVSRKNKYSVSELKHASMALQYDQMEGQAQVPEFLLQEKESYVPSFAAEGQDENGQIRLDLEQTASPGALRGTAVHRVMECLNFAAAAEVKQDTEAMHSFLLAELRRMTAEGLLSDEMRNLVYPAQIEPFLLSETGRRMETADAKGLLFREKPFVMQYQDVLVQGIMDVFWMEEDHIVLLDYKTDRVHSSEELVLRYKTQLDLYRDALDKIFKGTGHTVKECLIYSFRLEEVITL